MHSTKTCGTHRPNRGLQHSHTHTQAAAAEGQPPRDEVQACMCYSRSAAAEKLDQTAAACCVPQKTAVQRQAPAWAGFAMEGLKAPTGFAAIVLPAHCNGRRANCCSSTCHLPTCLPTCRFHTGERPLPRVVRGVTKQQGEGRTELSWQQQTLQNTHTQTD